MPEPNYPVYPNLVRKATSMSSFLRTAQENDCYSGLKRSKTAPDGIADQNGLPLYANDLRI